MIGDTHYGATMDDLYLVESVLRRVGQEAELGPLAPDQLAGLIGQLARTADLLGQCTPLATLAAVATGRQDVAAALNTASGHLNQALAALTDTERLARR